LGDAELRRDAVAAAAASGHEEPHAAQHRVLGPAVHELLQGPLSQVDCSTICYVHPCMTV
jgi:hypothetical protein